MKCIFKGNFKESSKLVFKIIGLSTVIILVGGVHTPSALEPLCLVKQDAIPDLYIERKYKYENSMKAHGVYFKEPRLLKSDYIIALDNFETMLNDLSKLLPHGYGLNDSNEQISKLKIELHYLESLKHDLGCLRRDINEISYTADNAEYVELTNTKNHKIALKMERELFEFFRR